jgi:putative ABC transport system permease protein
MLMQVKPILASLRWHKAGTILIALQIALTLAVVCNALFIVQQRMARLLRPSGVDESSLLVIQNQWAGKPATPQIPALLAADLDTLRHVPGVVDAFSSNSYPLSSTSGWSMGVRYTRDQKTPTTPSAIYFADQHALSTMGLRLVDGRNFREDEITDLDARATLAPPIVIITRALAEKLFPKGQAVGKTLCIGNAGPSTIIGVVERMQTFSGSFADSWVERSTLVPYRILSGISTYIIRARPGQLDQVVRAAPAALFAANRLRSIDASTGVQTFAEIRGTAYKTDSGVAILMAVICALLLAVTAAGIVGLTSFWVSQRRRQIGVRRALGATRSDILNYFLTENLMISLGGVIVGTLLAIGLNMVMISQFEMARLSLSYVVIGVVAVLLLGQASVLMPALRASRVSPVEATRTA